MADSEHTTADTARTPTGTVALEQRERAAVLRVSGALDVVLAPELEQLFARALRLEPELVVIDLTEVEFLASAGMATLVKTHRQVPAPARLHVVAVGRNTLRPLQITQLTEELAVFPTLAAALAEE